MSVALRLSTVNAFREIVSICVSITLLNICNDSECAVFSINFMDLISF